MENRERRSIAELFEEGAAIDAALMAAAREAVLQHKQKGLPLAVWRKGKVAWASPEEIEIAVKLQTPE